jgi:hypothetical protein
MTEIGRKARVRHFCVGEEIVMPSYILFDEARRLLQLRCSACHTTVVLSTSARLTPSGQILPNPIDAIRQHYVRSPLSPRCKGWAGETQTFCVKDVTRKLRTHKFSWPNPEEEDDFEYYMRCTVCSLEEGYSGPTHVGMRKSCGVCEHPLFQHTIIVATIFADPQTAQFETPHFT